MKVIKNKDLPSMRLRGKVKEKVKQFPKIEPTPKNEMEELSRVVAQAVTSSSENLGKVVEAIKGVNINVPVNVPEVKIPEVVIPESPKKWTFNVQRDTKGYIETITAERE